MRNELKNFTRTSVFSRAKSRLVLSIQQISQQIRWDKKSFQRFTRFLAVGASGLVVNNVILAAFTEIAGFHYLLSAIVATQGSTLWNFSLTELLVFGDRSSSRSIGGRLISFLLMNNLFLLLRGPLLAFLTSGMGIHYVLSNLISIFIMTILRYLFSDKWIWRRTIIGGSEADTYYYDIHGIVQVESPLPLPELEYFKTKETFQPDIRIRFGTLPSSQEFKDLIIYKEGMNGSGFGITVNIGEPTEVVASPILKKSPHVLYTNVVEPILRWTFARKGYALIHGACLSADDTGLMITARTDTGKTTTILQAISNFNYAFLSDDMTILGPRGHLWSFPKPLTISRHTLRAVKNTDLSLKERIALQFQSLLHSRSGRLFGLLLAGLNLPAATINTFVQMIVPPPKYMVQRLIPKTSIKETSKLAVMAVIDRGQEEVMLLKKDLAVDTLIRNSENAYGFPPYPVIGDKLCRWNGIDLHEKERDIISNALDGCEIVHLSSSDFGWWRRLPKLILQQQKVWEVKIAGKDYITVPLLSAERTGLP